MTGLDPENDRIIEIATIVTDCQLNELAEGPVIAIQQTQAVMDGMDAWNTRQHGKTGLTDRVLASEVSVAEAEARTLGFLSQWVNKGASPMCGNSICQDRRFLAKSMPELERFFHYRNLDVSTVKILAMLWAPEIAAAFTKESEHRALADIRDSIAELDFYRSRFINPEALQADDSA